MTLEFSRQFLEKYQIPNFMKIYSVGAADLLHAGGQMDRQT